MRVPGAVSLLLWSDNRFAFAANYSTNPSSAGLGALFVACLLGGTDKTIRIGGRGGAMTAVDFVPFVERLAKVSGEAIMPFFRTAFAMEDKSGGGVFDPVTEADRARGSGHAPADRRGFSPSWRDRRGIRRAGPGCRLCLGARPDRRHQELHRRTAAVGHADRPAAQRRALLRPDAPALHAREILSATAKRAHWAGRGANGETSTRRLRRAPAPASTAPR